MQMITLYHTLIKKSNPHIKFLFLQSEVAIEWFTINQMHANPDKFQAMIIQRIFPNPTKTNEFHNKDSNITPEPMLKSIYEINYI